MDGDLNPSFSANPHPMRLFCLICLLAVTASPGLAQPVKSTPAQITCESLTAELFAAIRANPAKLEMRLEEALIIRESCTAEIVTAAIDAVNADPALVQKIVKTAMDISPTKAALITSAVKHYQAPSVAMAPVVEVRRAEPAVVSAAPQVLPGEELRRAELPLETRSIPIVEVRKAEAPGTALPMAVLEQERVMNLTDVPKARPMR